MSAGPQVNSLDEKEDGNVVRQPPCVVVGVSADRVDCELSMDLTFFGRLAAGVVLNNPHLQLAAN